MVHSTAVQSDLGETRPENLRHNAWYGEYCDDVIMRACGLPKVNKERWDQSENIERLQGWWGHAVALKDELGPVGF